MPMTASVLPSPANVAAAVQQVLPRVQAAWLFGSAAEPERLRSDSDIDVAVWVDEPLNPAALWTAQQALAERLGRDVDVLDYLRLPTVMQVQVLTTGHLLFDHDPVRTSGYNGFVRTEYQHIQRWRQPMMAALAKRLQHAGASA